MLGEHNSKQDLEIEAILNSTPGYQVDTTIGGAPTWFYLPAYRKAHIPLPSVTLTR